MNESDLFSPSALLNLTVHQTPSAPIYASTPLVTAGGQAPSSTSSSFFLPLTENCSQPQPQPPSDQLVKLNEDLCLLGFFDFLPSTINIEQTLTHCRQLVKNYNKLAQEKQQLYEKLKKFQTDQVQQEKREESVKQDLDRLHVKKERLNDDVHDYIMKIQQLTQTVQIKEKEIRRINQVFAQQSALAKHQYRNLERQTEKLKERVLNFEKNRMSIASVEFSWPLVLNEMISSTENPSEKLLRKICHDYDQKHRLLMIENDQLRQSVIGIRQHLEHLLLIHRSPTDPRPTAIEDDESFESQLMQLPSEHVYEIVQRYFSLLYDQIDNLMWKGKSHDATLVSL